MSKIEICALITGIARITTKQGVVRTVLFEEKPSPDGPIGFAEVDEEIAEQCLRIPSEFWKPGTRGQSTAAAIKTALDADPVARKAADDLLGGKSSAALLAENEDLKARLAALEGGAETEKGKGKKGRKEVDIAPTLEAIKLAETVEEIDAIVTGLPESPALTEAVAARKSELAA